MKTKKAKIDLMAFCHPCNPKYALPFDLNGQTCATNGAIFIRMAERVRMKKGKAPVKDMGEYFDECRQFAGVTKEPVPPIKLREARAVCPVCAENRDGIVDKDCLNCAGEGFTIIKVGKPQPVGAAHISPRYHKLLLSLPGCLIYPASIRMRPFPRGLYFTFEGGEGILMPITCAVEEEGVVE